MKTSDGVMRYKQRNRIKIAAAQRVYYSKNRDRVLKQQADYYLKNRETALSRSKHYAAKNKVNIRAYGKLWREKNKEKVREDKKKWAAENPEKVFQIRHRGYWRDIELSRSKARQKAKARYAKNKTAALLASSRWASHNPEKKRACWLSWALRNGDRIRATASARRAKKRAATIGNTSTILEWIKEIRSKPFTRCHWCGTKVSGSNIHFDHVVALAKGGSHSIDNLCVSCQPCNSKKYTKPLSEWSVNSQTFLPL